jgi:hypothetical protein
MKQLFFSLAMVLLAVASRGQKTIITDPNAQPRAVSGFHAIEVSSAIDLYLSQSDYEAVAVSARETKYRDRIRTEVKDGVLKIWYENEGWKWDAGNRKLKAYVSFKEIEKLSASGASDIYVDGVIHGGKLDMRLSGASDFKGAVKLTELRIDQSGASDVSINGSVGIVNIEASGASDVKGYDLVADSCTVKASGASDIRISVNKQLNAHVSGASSVHYKGDAVIHDLHSSGASNVSRKG